MSYNEVTVDELEKFSKNSSSLEKERVIILEKLVQNHFYLREKSISKHQKIETTHVENIILDQEISVIESSFDTLKNPFQESSILTITESASTSHKRSYKSMEQEGSIKLINFNYRFKRILSNLYY
jgi:hypothetical protein